VRVAYVCADAGVPVFGRKGCSVHVREVLRALVRRGCDVALFAARLDGDPPTDLDRLRVRPLTAPAGPDPAARERQALAANAALDRELRQQGPFDIVYERHSLWSFAAMEYARETGTPGVLEVNAPLVEEQTRYRRLEDRDGALRAEERSFAAARAIVAVSREMARLLEEVPAARGRVRVVANGVDPERFRPGLEPRVRAGDGIFTVGFAGSLKPWHGLPTLVEAFAEFHAGDAGTRLLVVGDGPLREELEDTIDERGLSGATHLTGAVEPADVPGFLASMDAAVAPYPDPEDGSFYFSPLKVYEYMAAGLPVVASRTGDLADLLEDGRCGILCAPGDTRDFAGALRRLRADPDLRRRLGGAARARIVAECTWDRVVDRLLEAALPATPAVVGEIR
jgi:glycosyltransferase involved in cell wall biosynthesis